MRATLYVCTTCKGLAFNAEATAAGASGLASPPAGAPAVAAPAGASSLALASAAAPGLAAPAAEAPGLAPPTAAPGFAVPTGAPDLAVPAAAPDLAPAAEAPLPGARLAAALALGLPPGVTLRPVECLSACSQGCAVALAAPGKWTYVYGRLTPEDAADILTGAAAYAASPDGLVPWRDRPAIFRKQSLARIPPQE